MEKARRIPGEIVIQKGDVVKNIPGEIIPFGNKPPAQVLKELAEKSESSFDYYVFSQPSDDPSRPERTATYAIATDAAAFDGAGANSFKLYAPNELGLLAPINAKYYDRIDRVWDKPVTEVSVAVNSDKVSANEKRLLSRFHDLLMEKIGGKPPSYSAVMKAVSETIVELEQLCWGLSDRGGRPDVSFEFVDRTPDASYRPFLPHKREEPRDVSSAVFRDPAQPSGVRLKVRVEPASDMIVLQGLPEEIGKEAKEKFTELMQASLDAHPLVFTREIGNMDGPSPRLSAHDVNGVLSWHFPLEMPLPGDVKSNFLKEIAGGKSLDNMAIEKRGGSMPVPLAVIEIFRAWLVERLQKVAGSYRVEFKPRSDMIRVERIMPPSQLVITDRMVELIRDDIGVDLAPEQAELARGTLEWGREKMAEFAARLKDKFRKSGHDFKTLEENVNKETVELFIQPFKLLKSGDVSFTGDDVKLIGEEKLREALGDTPMSLEDVAERLKKVEEAIHKAGYLVAGETPDRQEGIQLKPVLLDGGKRVEIPVIVARTGKIKVVGDVTETSREAAAKPFAKMKVGEPLRVDLLKAKLRAARVNLALQEDEDVPALYVTHLDGRMDVTYNVERNNEIPVEIGGGTTSTGKPVFNAEASLQHRVPGMQSVSASYFMSADGIWQTALAARTLPLNDQGVSLSAKGFYGEGNYVHRRSGDGIIEEGYSRRGGGTLKVHVPATDDGIASPVLVSPGVHGEVVNRRIAKPDDKYKRKTNVYVGEDVDVGTIFTELMAEDDAIRTTTGFGLDHNLTERMGDATASADASYTMPLGKYFALNVRASTAYRFHTYGNDGKLDPDRLFAPETIPIIDFSRRLGDPYAANYFWNSGLFVVFSRSPYFQPAVGATLSGKDRGGAGAGAGLVLNIPAVGLSIYFGTDTDGRITYGIGARGSFRIY